jgi:hypothetical protein
VLGLLGVLAIFALLYGNAKHQISTARVQVVTLTAQAQRAQAEAARLAPYTSFLALQEQRTQAVNQLVDSRFDWAHAFHELGRVLPIDASISSLSGQVGATPGSTGGGTTGAAATGAAATRAAATSAATTPSAASAASAAATTSAAVTSATPPGSVPTFTLSGCATSQSEVALTLDRLRLIDGVSEVTLQSSTTASGAGGAGGCVGKDPAFAMQATFEPLPSASATTATSTTSTASTSAVTPATAQPTTATGGAR